MVAELVLTEVDVAQRQLVVLEARSDELLDSIHFDSVSAHVEHLEPAVLEKALPNS